METNKFNYNLAKKHFVLTDQWEQAVQLITYEANNGNLEISLTLLQINQGDVSDSYPSHMQKGVSLQ